MVSGVTLEKLKQFEMLVKKCIIAKYGKYIPADKLAFLKETSFIDESILKDATSKSKIQGDVIRRVLYGVIDIKCEKMLEIADSESTFILYGEYLEKGLIEYYTRRISNEYSIDITERPDLEGNLDLVIKLYEKLGEGLDPMVFNSTAMEILDNAELQELIKTCDVEAIKAFVAKKEGVENLGVGSAAEEKQIKEDFGVEGRISIVYLHGKQYIKYIDKFDEVHLVETRNPGIISEVYKERFKNLKPGETIDPEEFFNELTKLVEETDLKPEDEINRDQLSAEEVNMVDFIYANKELKDDVSADVVKHDTESGIHVVEETDEIVVTDDHGTYVDATLVGGVEPGMTPDGTQSDLQEQMIIGDEDDAVKAIDADGDGTISPEEADVNGDGVIDEDDDPMILVDESTRILSYEEYEALCKKFANNEELTLDELRALKRSTPELMAIRKQQEELARQQQMLLAQQESQRSLEQDGPKLVMKSGQYPMAGFTNKYLICFVIVLTICIGVIVGALLFKLTH